MRTGLRPAAFAGALLLVLGPTEAALADTTVTVASARQTGASVAVAGKATFGDQPPLQMGTDEAGDTDLPNGFGQDLTSAALATTLDGKLVFTWTVAAMQSSPHPGVMYGWDFCASTGGTARCFEVDAFRFYDGNDRAKTGSAAADLWACADATCDPGAQERVAEAVTSVAVDAAAKTVTATVALSDLGAGPGSEITPVTVGPAPAFTSMGTAYSYDNGDDVAVTTIYVVPAKDVSLALGKPRKDPKTMRYTVAATVAEDGGFSGSVPRGTLPASNYAAYVRACFGTNNCGHATATVKLK